MYVLYMWWVHALISWLVVYSRAAKGAGHVGQGAEKNGEVGAGGGGLEGVEGVLQEVFRACTTWHRVP